MISDIRNALPGDIVTTRNIPCRGPGFIVRGATLFFKELIDSPIDTRVKCSITQGGNDDILISILSIEKIERGAAVIYARDLADMMRGAHRK